MMSRIFCHQSNSHEFELHRPSNKGTKLLLKVIKAIIIIIKCSAASSLPCFDTMPHIVACVCSPLCHHLYTIFHIVAWVCSFVSKYLEASLHVFAPHSLLPLSVLQFSRYYQMSNADLEKLLSCLAAPFFPRGGCSIRPLAPIFAYLRILNSLRQNVGSLIRWFSSIRFHFDQEGCCSCCNSLS